MVSDNQIVTYLAPPLPYIGTEEDILINKPFRLLYLISVKPLLRGLAWF
jgi:hypothetical protein